MTSYEYQLKIDGLHVQVRRLARADFLTSHSTEPVPTRHEKHGSDRPLLITHGNELCSTHSLNIGFFLAQLVQSVQDVLAQRL